MFRCIWCQLSPLVQKVLPSLELTHSVKGQPILRSSSVLPFLFAIAVLHIFDSTFICAISLRTAGVAHRIMVCKQLRNGDFLNISYTVFGNFKQVCDMSWSHPHSMPSPNPKNFPTFISPLLLLNPLTAISAAN